MRNFEVERRHSSRRANILKQNEKKTEFKIKMKNVGKGKKKIWKINLHWLWCEWCSEGGSPFVKFMRYYFNFFAIIFRYWGLVKKKCDFSLNILPLIFVRFFVVFEAKNTECEWTKEFVLFFSFQLLMVFSIQYTVCLCLMLINMYVLMVFIQTEQRKIEGKKNRCKFWVLLKWNANSGIKLIAEGIKEAHGVEFKRMNDLMI